MNEFDDLFPKEEVAHFHVTGVCLHCSSPKFLGIFGDEQEALTFLQETPQKLSEGPVNLEDVRARKFDEDVMEITYKGVHRTILLNLRCTQDIEYCQRDFKMYIISQTVGRAMQDMMESIGNSAPEDFESSLDDATANLLKDFNFPTDFLNGEAN